MINLECWEPAPGFEDCYLVSDLGRVMRIAGGRGARRGHILSPSQNSVTGYLTVILHKNGTPSARYVHRLVASAFHGLEPGAEVHHLDNDKANNQARNLCVTSRSDNMKEVASRKRDVA